MGNVIEVMGERRSEVTRREDKRLEKMTGVAAKSRTASEGENGDKCDKSEKER